MAARRPREPLSGDQPHPPTQQKLRQAYARGDIPKSRGFTAAISVLGAVAGCALNSAPWVAMCDFTRRSVAGESLFAAREIDLALQLAAKGSVGPLVGAFAGALAAHVLLGRGIRLRKLTFDFTWLDISRGLRRLSPGPAAYPLLRGSLASAIFAFVLCADIRLLVARAAFAATPALSMFPRAFVVKCAWLLFAYALVEAALVQRAFFKKMRMSLEEVRREHKESEGDPHQRAMRKSRHRSLAQGGPARGVATATVLVANPTHVAVALRYDERECSAPYVVARGVERDAQALRATARRLGVRVVRDIPLARSLINFDLGDPIPEELYEACAAVLRVALDEDLLPYGS